jgi:hypothetical protein
MGVERKLNLQNYAEDGGGTAVPPGDSRVRRVFPIDDYRIDDKLQPRSSFVDYHILQIPLLGQRGYIQANGRAVGDWCGRTSCSNLYNWFQLIKGGNPKPNYITHWDAGQPGFRLDLRTPDGLRAFYKNPESAVGNGDLGQYGHFTETWKDRLDKQYDQDVILGPTQDRARQAARFSEAEIEAQFKPVLQSLRLNNPVFLYSGFTQGRNHLILFIGYAHIVDKSGQAALWLCVADPATHSWLVPSDVLDLTRKENNLSQLTPGHNVIELGKGDWDLRRASLCLVRGKFFFKRKGDYASFMQNAATDPDYKAKTYDDFNQKDALFIDDVGNPGRDGGCIFASKDTKNVTVPEGAVLTTQAHCSFPFEVKGVAAAPIPMLHYQESRKIEDGGFYPLGAHDNLHGGIHLPSASAMNSGIVPVSAMAPGRIVAARLPARSTVPDPKATKDEPTQRHDFATELSGNTPNFVLVRHDLESVPKDKDDAKKQWTFYCLYMHLADPANRVGADQKPTLAGSPYAATPWLSALYREKHGAMTVIDPDARYSRDGKPEAPSLGFHYWPELEPDDTADPKAFKVIDPAKYTAAALIAPAPDGGDASKGQKKQQASTAPPDDGRKRFVHKPPEAKLEAALGDLAAGKLLTFAEPHPNLVVSAGTNLGWVARSAGSGEGFLHWEILSPPGDKGLEGIAKAAQERLAKTEVFPVFAEEQGTINNYLDKDEAKKLAQLLPKEDTDRVVVWGNLAALSFAGKDDATGIKPEEPLEKGWYHLRLDLSNFKGVLAAGTRKLTLTFLGTGGPLETTVDLDVPDPNSGEWFKTVQAPGWASEVKVACQGVMVRPRTKHVEDADVTAHLMRISKHRFRNLRLNHMNSWDEKKTLEDVKKLFADAPELQDLVKAVCFWGDDEHAVYGDQNLFAGEFKDVPTLDNLHPVVALWVLDLMLERGLVRFLAPPAGKAGTVEPLAKAWLPAVENRDPIVAGSPVSAIVVSNRWRTSEVQARLEAVNGDVRILIAEGRYQDGNLSGPIGLSGWGDFKLVVSHKEEDSSWSEKDAGDRGAPTLTVLEPKRSEFQVGPVIDKGKLVWDVHFDDNCPKQLEGYLLAETRVAGKDGDFTAVDLFFPVDAIEVPESTARLTWDGGYLIGAKPATKDQKVAVVAPGTTWSEVVLAWDTKQDDKRGPRIAKNLLHALGLLDGAYRAKVKNGDFRLLPGCLRAGGLRVDVAPIIPKGSAKTAADDCRAILVDAAKNLGVPGLEVVDSAGPPGFVTLSVGAPDNTPGGVLRVTCDPRPLLGQIVVAKKPAADEQLEVRFFLRFYNGGHVVPLKGSRDCGPDDVCNDVALVEARALSGIKNPHLKDVRSGGVDAHLALPRIKKIRYAYDAGGLRMMADPWPADPDFWKAAKPAFQLGSGAPKLASIGNGKLLSATFTPKEVGSDGVPSIVAKTTAAGTYGGAEIAAGDVPAEWDEGVASSLPKLDLSDITIDADGAYTVTVTGPVASLSVVVSDGNYQYKDRLTIDKDGVAKGQIETKRLGKTKRSFTVTITAKWEKELKKTKTWNKP